ncbi:recombination directionality factor [Streptacidiphilus melanogenes]|uniref:recombination directionality factor n=1 Tax=Streptacidiphilus melanogenes TaxID=411235 RepID=UPI000693F6FA|nr:hypothetical protein [Streptacidiphilus melanogenes]
MTIVPKSPGDVVGAFHFGRLVAGLPQTLSTWCFTTRDQGAAEAVAELLGGESIASPRGYFEVDTPCAALPVTLDSDAAVTVEMEHWKARAAARRCNGAFFQSEGQASEGEPCGCPQAIEDRRAMATRGTGASPVTTVRFTLADAPELGVFAFESRAWDMAEHAEDLVAQLVGSEGARKAELVLSESEFTSTDGLRVMYRRPLVQLAALSGKVASFPSRSATELSQAA